MLVGMPASGKTDLGRSYAHITGRSFLDFDHFVEKMAGKTVAEIFDSEGESGFRQWESKALQKLNRRHHSVIACGGGTFATDENVKIIQEMGLVVCLEAPLDMLAKRILPTKQNRPMFKDCVNEEDVELKLKELLELRAMHFEKAQIFVRTGFSSVDNLKMELCNREKKAWGEERRKKLKEAAVPLVSPQRPVEVALPMSLPTKAKSFLPAQPAVKADEVVVQGIRPKQRPKLDLPTAELQNAESPADEPQSVVIQSRESQKIEVQKIENPKSEQLGRLIPKKREPAPEAQKDQAREQPENHSQNPAENDVSENRIKPASKKSL
jgi:shikimate kinase